MRKTLKALLAAALLSALTASTALAAAPASPACLGASVSAAATTLGRDLGQLVALTARESTQGVGDEVQLILAGEFPDDAFPNSCND